MAFLQKRLAGPVAIATTASSTTAPGSATYTVPVSTTTIVKQIMVTNTTASAQVVTIWIKPSAATIASTHIIFHSLTLAANETTLINLSLVMAASDAIYVRTGASGLNVTVSGIEETP
ncbi:MAG: hypothetical protein O3A30_04005 [Bacteroidetes bacterium]|nr:hypothetical protein [Bacteroidota bacterium]